MSVLLRTAIAGIVLSSAPAACADVISVTLDPDLFGHLNQHEVSQCEGVDPGAIACGPTAAANSFAFLEQMYPDVYGTRLIPDGGPYGHQDGVIEAGELLSVADYLAVTMACGCQEPGTNLGDFIRQKQIFLEAMVPSATTYAAQDPVQWIPWDEARNGPVPRWLDPAFPTVSFLYDELTARGDVEIVINGGYNHYLNLTSLTWDDTFSPATGTIGFIDPETGEYGEAGIFLTAPKAFGGSTVIATTYAGPSGPRLSYVTGAVAESPVPEPSTLALVALGVAALLYRHRRTT